MNKYVKFSFFSFLCFWLAASLFEHYLMGYHNENLHQFFSKKIYEGFFPEYKFPVKKERKLEYANSVSAGSASMKQSRIVICGLARNCAESLARMEQRIEETGGLFRDYRVVIFENDSSDDTRALLKAWQKRNPKVHLLECTIPDCKLGSLPAYAEGGCSFNRLERMANFRNRYLAYAYKHYKKFDYMMVIDIDLKGPWSLDGLSSNFASQHWDGVFAYGLHTMPFSFGSFYGMYDVAAYVKDGDLTDHVMSEKGMCANYMRVNFRDHLFR